MTDTRRTRVLIVGGGPAGYTAGIYAARSGLEPIIVEGFEWGGQLSRSYLVENFPGVPDGTSGADLAARIREQAERFGATILTDDVIAADLDRFPFSVTTTDGAIEAESLIIATGSQPRPLGIPGEEGLVGRGIAYCALCDGVLFAGKKVVVVGGGNAAVGEALAMSRVAAEVTLIHRRNEFRAHDAVFRALEDSPVQVRTPVIVEDLVADDNNVLCGMRLRDLDTGTTEYVEANGLFVAIGHIPELGVFAPFIDAVNGHVVTDHRSTATSRPGVFAAGDVADSQYRQAITAAASGCMAAVDAENWLVTGSTQQTESLVAQRH